MSNTLFNLPLIQSYRPRNFRDRGVAPPFTTRFLIGARLRQMPGVAGLEVIVPNPSGGRGVYILPWDTVSVLGRPSMHDVMLGRTLATILGREAAAVSPRYLAEAVEQVAREGLAGPLVAEATLAQAKIAQAALLETRLRLLLGVTAQVEGIAADSPAITGQSDTEIEQRGLAALNTLAERWAKPPQRLGDAMDRLAALFAEIGMGDSLTGARLPRLVSALGELHRDMTVWAQSESGQSGACPAGELRDAVAVARSADLVARMAHLMLDSARQALRDPVAGLKHFLTAQSDLESVCERGFWLLDGWELICRLWHSAPSLMPRHAALADMARSLPLLPDEAETWLGLPPGTAEQLERASSAPPRMRTTAADQMALLEKLRLVPV